MLRSSHILVVALFTVTVVGCGDDSSAPAAGGRSQVATGSQDYTWIDIQLSGYPAGSSLILRPTYWDAGELTADPQAGVTATSATTFRVEFLNLAAGNFVGANARILLAVVDSAVDELQGVVILCDSSGPIIIAPECQGDCAPLCGLPGHDCNG
jgi:hypothetical protein